MKYTSMSTMNTAARTRSTVLTMGESIPSDLAYFSRVLPDLLASRSGSYSAKLAVCSAKAYSDLMLKDLLMSSIYAL